MTLVQNVQAQRWKDVQIVQARQVQRFSEIFAETRQLQRWKDVQFVQKSQLQRWRELSPSFVAAVGPQSIVNPTVPPAGGGGGGAVGSYAKFLAPRYRVWINNSATNTNYYLCDSTSNILKSFRCRTKKNSGVAWSAELVFNPQLLGSGGIANLLASTQPSSFAGDNNIVQRLICEIEVGGTTVQLPQMVILRRRYQSRPDGFSLQVSGLDIITRLMNKRNFNTDSFVSTTANIIFSKTILSTLLPLFNVNNAVLNYDDFPVRNMHIQNERPVDILNSILEIPRAFWYVQGSTLVTAPWVVAPNPNWIYQDVPNALTDFTYEEDSNDLINTVKVQLEVPAGIIGPTISNTAGKPYGSFSATFNTPLLRPSFQTLQAVNGQILSIDYFDKQGNWLAHFPHTDTIQLPPGTGNGGWGGSGLASSAIVVWAPPQSTSTLANANISTSGAPPQTVFQGYFKGSDPLDLLLTGFVPPANAGPYVMPTQIINSSTLYQNGQVINTTPPTNQPVTPDQQYSVIVQDGTSVQNYGILEAEHPVIKPLIPNLPWGWRFGVGVLQESGRFLTLPGLSFPINPLLNVGDTVQAIENVRGISVTGIVEEHTLQFDSQWGESIIQLAVYPS